MKNSVVHFVFALQVLLFAGVLEEMLPKLMGVGMPLLLAASFFVAARWPILNVLLFAAAAGAVEDALSGLPVMTSVSYFLLVILVARWAKAPRLASCCASLLFPLWISMWNPAQAGNVFLRVLGMIPMGLLATGMVWLVLGIIERKAAIDEQG